MCATVDHPDAIFMGCVVTLLSNPCVVKFSLLIVLINS